MIILTLIFVVSSALFLSACSQTPENNQSVNSESQNTGGSQTDNQSVSASDGENQSADNHSSAGSHVHDYRFDSFVWDGFTAKAKYICIGDDSHVEYHDATIASEVTAPANCTESGVKTYTATYNGHTDTKAEDLAALSHELTHYDAKSATCTDIGWAAYDICLRCDYSTYVELPALSHDYIFDSFIWTDYTAKAKYVCKNDNSHVEYLDATITSEVTTAPTCINTGLKTYTATYDGHTDTKTETLELIEHNYVDDYCSVCGEWYYADGLTYELNSEGTKYTVTSIGSAKNTDIIISPRYNDKPVTKIGDFAFNGCSGLTSIVIPESVTVIGRYAFSNCGGLKSIIIPDSVISIGDSAFKGCSSLESMTIPFVGNSVKTVSSTYQYPFGYIFGTSSYTGGTKTAQFYYGGNTSSATNTTYYIPASLKSVTVTGGDILYGAFSNCSGLTSVTIDNGVTSIESSAFSGCSGLTSLTIGGGVTSIGSSAFNNCSGLKSLIIGDGVTNIGNSAFDGCSAIVYNKHDNAYYLGNQNNPYLVLIKARDTSITSCSVNSNTKIIYYRAFFDCYGLTSVSLPDGVTNICESAFCLCSRLTSIIIPDSVISIGNSAFNYCTGLTSIIIPDGVISIGDGVFSNCSGLTSIIIPDSVTSIGESAFGGCIKLTSIVIPESVTDIGRYAFSNCGRLTSIVIPDGVISIGDGAFNYCSGLTSIIIPDSVTNIGKGSFGGCSGLAGVIIPNSVTSIGEYSFSDCVGLASIIIPDSVTNIGKGSFGGCSSLESITIPFVGGSKKTANDTYQYPFGYIFGLSSDTVGIATIQYFYGFSTNYTSSAMYYIPASLKSVTVTGGEILYGAFYNCSGLTSITLPDGATGIGDYAFYNCSGLTSIVIHESVISIGDSAFGECSGLNSVTFKNTSGWYVYASSAATSGTSVPVEDAAQNAVYLKSTYLNYYWKREQNT